MAVSEGNLEWLLPDSQELNGWAADRGLAASFRVVAAIDSTQDFFRRSAVELVPGQTLIADFQSGGHGRLDRSWVAPAGSALLMSTVVSAPDPLLPLVAGLAATDALQRWVPAIGLKWPNDIVLPAGDAEPFKLGGIVIAVQAQRAIVGIGINLRLPTADRPTAVARSVADFASVAVPRNEVAIEVLTALEARLAAPAATLRDYRRRCATIGAQVVVSLPGQPPLSAVALDVADDGGLVVDTGSGRQTLRAADVVHVRRN